MKVITGDSIEWSTKTGTFKTNKQCKITFSMPQFHKDRDVTWTVCVDENKEAQPRYDMILGRDLMHELGMIFDFKEGRMTWDNSWINMQNPSLFDEGSLRAFEEELFLMHDPDTTDAERIQQIVDAKYNAANLQEEVLKVNNLNKEERKQLYKLLKKYGTLFDGALGTWKTEPINIQLKDPNCVPYHAKPYPVPHSQEKKLKAEIKHLVD